MEAARVDCCLRATSHFHNRLIHMKAQIERAGALEKCDAGENNVIMTSVAILENVEKGCIWARPIVVLLFHRATKQYLREHSSDRVLDHSTDLQLVCPDPPLVLFF